MTKQRQSNIELLRIVAMFLIVLTHANIFSLGRPKMANFEAEPVWTGVRFAVQSFSYIGVNLFILISGYFGIKPRFKAVSSFLFYVLFFSLFCLLGLWIVGLAIGQPLVKPEMWGNALRILTKYNWFIPAYLMLMLFAPALNSWCAAATRRQLLLATLLLFAASTYLGWMTHGLKEFLDGYSFPSLILLYLIGRYLRLHGGYLMRRSRRTDMIHFLAYVAVNTALALWRIPHPYEMSLFALNNPLQLYGTVCFFAYFTKLHFQNQTVNSIARSTFGIFLLQMHPQVMPWFRKAVKYLYGNAGHGLFSAEVVGLVIAFCIAGILIDRLRAPLWRQIDEPLDRLYHRLKAKLPAL